MADADKGQQIVDGENHALVLAIAMMADNLIYHRRRTDKREN